MAKKKENNNQVDSSQHGASHLTSDKSDSFKQVSFNVLENAYEKKVKEAELKNKNFKGRAIISSDEMLPSKKSFWPFKKRKQQKNPKLGKLAVAVLALIIVFGILTSAGVYLSNSDIFYQPKNSNELKMAILNIGKYDKEIIKLNEFLENPINQYSINQFATEKDSLSKVKDDLNELSDEISEIGQGLDLQSDDYYYVPIAKQTIESRIMMIDSGLKIYDSAQKNVDLINKTETFWSNILKADASLKESDNLIQSNDVANFILAKKCSEDAANSLNEAITQIKELGALGSSFDFSVYLNYANIRLESALISQSACQALIDSDIENIAALNVAYIEKSNKASDIALTMSTTPGQLIRTNYDLSIRPIIDEFKAARQNAAENDLALRNYIYS